MKRPSAKEEDLAADLWSRISARYLETPGLRDLCLEMQALHDVDIVLALFFWAADAAGRSPTPTEALALEAGIKDWRDTVVRPIRNARKWLKSRMDTPAEALFRDRLKALELEAERLELAWIARSFEGSSPENVEPDSPSAARRYLENRGVDPARITAFLTT